MLVSFVCCFVFDVFTNYDLSFFTGDSSFNIITLFFQYFPVAAFCGADAFDFAALFQNTYIFFYSTS